MIKKLEHIIEQYDKYSVKYITWQLIRRSKCIHKFYMLISACAIIIISYYSYKNQWIMILSFIPMIYFVTLLFKIEKYVYKKYYKEYPFLIQRYIKDRQFLRFLLFKKNLKYNLTKDEIDSIIHIISIDLDSYQISLITKHPLIVFIFGVITAVFSGLMSQDFIWKDPKHILIIGYLLLLIVFFSAYSISIFKTKEYKIYELKQMLLWLKIHSDITYVSVSESPQKQKDITKPRSQ